MCPFRQATRKQAGTAVGVTLEGIDLSFGKTHVLKGIDLKIEAGEFFAFLGPSGCGKSTLLNMIVGLEDVSAGEIRVDEQRVNEVDPKDRNMAMVFQSYAIYPHMTVRENMAFPLKLARLPRNEIARRVEQAADMLELRAFLERKPRSLSGGQRQRVAMGRAMVREPRAFLLDEPLSNLDAKLRVQMRTGIARLQRRLGTTTLYVTHDQTEAMTLGDRIAVLANHVEHGLAIFLESCEGARGRRDVRDRIEVRWALRLRSAQLQPLDRREACRRDRAAGACRLQRQAPQPAVRGGGSALPRTVAR